MLARVLLIIPATVHFAEFKPKGKYYLIETKDKGEVKDDGETEDDGDMMDMMDMTEDMMKPMMTEEGKITYHCTMRQKRPLFFNLDCLPRQASK